MKHIVKVDRRGRQVRVTIPRELVEATAFKSASHALIWKGANGFVCIHPFIDGAMLREGVQRNRGQQDPGAEGSGSS